jgi:hypothetical protein
MCSACSKAGAPSSFLEGKLPEGQGQSLPAVYISAFGFFILCWFIRADGSDAGDPTTPPVAANGKIYISNLTSPSDSLGGPTRGYVEIIGQGVRQAGSIVVAGDGFIAATPLRAAAAKPAQYQIFALSGGSFYFFG